MKNKNHQKSSMFYDPLLFHFIKQGDLEKIKEILTPINQHEIFKNQCLYNDAFVISCHFGNVELVEWLLELKPNEISVFNHAFRESCCNGNLKVAQMLLKRKPKIDISMNNECAFRESCKKGHIEVVQWLFEQKPDINVSAKNDEAFIWACKFEHVKVAQWLQSLRPWLYKITNNDKYSSLSAHINTKEEQTAHWLKEERFQRIKYLVFFASSSSLKPQNQKCVFYKLPSELLREITLWC